MWPTRPTSWRTSSMWAKNYSMTLPNFPTTFFLCSKVSSEEVVKLMHVVVRKSSRPFSYARSVTKWVPAAPFRTRLSSFKEYFRTTIQYSSLVSYALIVKAPSKPKTYRAHYAVRTHMEVRADFLLNSYKCPF